MRGANPRLQKEDSMYINADYDLYGNAERLTSDDFRRILDLIDGYMKVPYRIVKIWRDDTKDPNRRIDIEVEYADQNGRLVVQKLLILKDELIDGLTFHKRYREWYKREENK